MESCFAFLCYYYNIFYEELNLENDISRTFSRLACLFSMSAKNTLSLVRCEYQLGSCNGSIDEQSTWRKNLKFNSIVALTSTRSFWRE